MPATLQPEILLATLKYDFKVMQRENSPNEVQKWYPRGTNFFGVQTVRMGYCTPKWGTVGNPVSHPCYSRKERKSLIFLNSNFNS